jgi:hypothetical protein
MTADLESAYDKPIISEHGVHKQQFSDSDRTAVQEEITGNVVDWDGPDDPEHPQNWPAWKRMTQIVFATTFLLTA